MGKKYLYPLLLLVAIALVTLPRINNVANESCVYHQEAYQGLEIPKLSRELSTTGMLGRIHGAVNKSNIYVMSVREPDNFFSHREFSLITSDSNTVDTLNRLNRHDLVCVTGDIITNPSPQKHITVNSIQVLEPWEQPKGFTPYERQANIPEELKQQTSFVGKVHAIGAEGKILVVEYRDGIIPIYVRATEYTQNLYRGDIVKLNYQIQSYPQQPTHLQLDTTADKPLEVLDAIASWNDKANTLIGNLVKFPRSPQLKFDVYAMEVDTQGIKRYFTLINFTDMTEFENIRTKLADIWDENKETAVKGRNMLINPQVTIQARGITNIVSPEQANPQILLDSAASVDAID